MTPRTRQLAKELINAPWFEHVGEPLPDDTAIQIDSMKSAIKSCCSHEWDVVRNEARNGVTLTIGRDHPDRYEDWNSIVEAINKEMRPNIDHVFERLAKTYNLPGRVSQVLLSTVRMACLESEYSGYSGVGFFQRARKLVW